MPFDPSGMVTPCWLQLTTCGARSVMVEQLEWTLQLPNGKEENFTGDAPKSIREVVLLDHGCSQQMEVSMVF